ncbi:MAG: SURF1 family protein [Hyphomicrobiales bacterium]|nr:SURF1 family protein [Hyphomicrobiales bacterium]MBV8661649.1 SURF1 family protein [Hyphomicrobiales bacterium]
MNRRVLSLVAPAIATLAGVVILIGLGDWQLHRLAWKEGLIAEVTTRVHAAPVEPPAEADWPSLKPSDYEYRHVRIAGVYDGAHQALVYRALENPHGPYAGPGYLVITPLRRADGSVILVNRGFVPEDQKDKAALAANQGQTIVTGLMRSSEERNFFTPADDPAKGRWYTRDVAAIAHATELQRHAPFSIDADAGADRNALPEGGETIIDFPNNHFSYAMTWFGMALALIGVFVAFAMSQLRGPDEPDGGAGEKSA